METKEYAELKRRRRELADLIDAKQATPEQQTEYKKIVSRIKADPPTLEQVYATMGDGSRAGQNLG